MWQPLLRFLALGLLAASATTLVPAAAFLNSSPSLQTVIDLMDFNPLAADETFDIRGGNPLTPAYNATAQTTNTQNDNTAQGTASINATLDAAALRFGASGEARFEASMNFDSADIASGAVLDVRSSSHYSVHFRLAGAGIVRLAGTILAGGAGGTVRSALRIERLDGSGIALWAREVSGGSLAIGEDVALAAGDYLFLSAADAANGSFRQASALLLDASAGYNFTGEIIETAPPPPPPEGKGKPRR